MKRLAIDFAAVSGARPNVPAYLHLLWLAPLVALLLGGWQWLQIKQQNASLERALQASVQQAFWQSGKPPAQATGALKPAQRQALNEAVKQLNLPWAAWFAAFERAAQPKVTLLAINPSTQGSTLAISAESDSVERMLAYVEALRRTGFFRDVVLRRHRSDDSVAGGSVQFELLAYPQGAAP